MIPSITEVHDDAISVADLNLRLDGQSLWLARLYVPPRYRGQGVGGRLMARVLAYADSRGQKLYLSINPYGDLSYTQLYHWYKRLGFHQQAPNLFVRFPALRYGC